MENREPQPLEEAEETAGQEEQEEEIQPLRISRRDFLIGAGSGAVVGAAAATGIAILTRPSAVAPPPGAPPVTAPPVEAIPVKQKVVALKVNGVTRKLEIAPHWTLLQVLREQLGLTGTKRGCDLAMCGACTVLLDGRPVNACTQLAIRLDGREILTIEGLAKGDQLHPVQRAFVEHQGMQCGFCTPGQIMSAVALLGQNPNPSREEVRQALAGNLCRCGAYPKIIESVLAAAKMA